MLGRDGMDRVAEYSTLNANYLARRLADAGFDLAYPDAPRDARVPADLRALEKQTGVNAMDLAKRLLDYGRHSPTTYFPLLVPECWLVEPTETRDARDPRRRTSTHCCDSATRPWLRPAALEGSAARCQ